MRYADDSVIIAENKEDLKLLLDIFEEEIRKKGLKLNSNKTEIMVISRNDECPQINIFINCNKLKQRDQFKYFATLIAIDTRKYTEIALRIAQEKIDSFNREYDFSSSKS